MEKGFRLRKKRTGQWVCLAGVTLALATMGSQLVSAEQVPWVARTVEMVKKDLKESKDSTTYLIKWGDTLSVIAKAVDMDMNILAQINKIANVDLIYAGNTLSISKDGKRIVVDNGDTAQAYRVVEPAPAESRAVENPEPARVERVAEFDSQDRQAIQNYVDRGQIAPVAPTTSNRPQTEVTRPRPITEPSRQGEIGTSHPIRPIFPAQPLIPPAVDRPSISRPSLVEPARPSESKDQAEHPSQPSPQERPVAPSHPSETGTQAEHPSQPSPQERPVAPSHPSETGTQAEHPSQPSPQERPVVPSQPSETGTQAEHPSQPSPQERPIAPSQPSETGTQAEHPNQPSTQEDPATPVTPAPVVENATNLSELVANDKSAIPLPVVHEEVLSETVREETVAVESAPTESAPETPKPIESTPTPAATETAPTEASSGEAEASSASTSPETGASETSSEVSSPAPSQPAPSPVEQPSSPATKTVKVLERVVRVTETIPYPVVYQEDDSLAVGETKVLSEGTMGATVTMQTVTLKDGVEVSRETSSTSTTEAVSRIVKVGTRKATMPTPAPSQPAKPAEEKPQTKQLPQKETVYTEVTNRTSPKEVTDQKELENILKDATAQLAIPSMTNDKLATTNLVTIYDNTLFEGRKQLENIQASYVTVAVKRKREVQGQEDQIETLLTKDIPVFTGTVRIGTRKAGYETKTSTGQTVTLSSKEEADKLATVKIYDNISPDFAKRNPAYLGTGVTLASDKPIGKSELSINYDASALRADSHPTIYRSDATGKLVEVPTSLQGNTAVATVTQLGTYVLMDKKVPKKEVISPESPSVRSPQSVVFVFDRTGYVTSEYQKKGRQVVLFDHSNDEMELKSVDLTKQFVDELDKDRDIVAVGKYGKSTRVLTRKFTSNFMSVKEVLQNVLANALNPAGVTEYDEPYDSIRGNGPIAYVKDTDLSRLLSIDYYKDGFPDYIDSDKGHKENLVLLTTKNRESDPKTNEIIKMLIRSRKHVYIVGFGFKEVTADNVYTRIAEATNGKFYYAKDVQELENVFKQLKQDILHPQLANRLKEDWNGDGLSAYHSKEIFKGHLLSEDGKQVFESKVEEFRKKLSSNILDFQHHGYKVVTKEQEKSLENYSSLTEEQKQAIFNPIIDSYFDDSYFENQLSNSIPYKLLNPQDSFEDYEFNRIRQDDGLLFSDKVRLIDDPVTGKSFLRVYIDPNRYKLDNDKNKDGLKPLQTKAIFKGELLAEDGSQVFERDVEAFRKDLAESILSSPESYKMVTASQREALSNYNQLTEEQKKAILNPVIDLMPAGLFEYKLERDADQDGLVNKDEVAVFVRPSDGKQFLRAYSNPYVPDNDWNGDGIPAIYTKELYRVKPELFKNMESIFEEFERLILENPLAYLENYHPEYFSYGKRTQNDFLQSLKSYSKNDDRLRNIVLQHLPLSFFEHYLDKDIDKDGLVNGFEWRPITDKKTGKLDFLKKSLIDNPENDWNKDGIPWYYTEEILKGNLLSKFGEQLFEKQVEDYRKNLIKDILKNPEWYDTVTEEQRQSLKHYDELTEQEKQKIFNPIIENSNSNSIDYEIGSDPDGDGIINGDEVRILSNPMDSSLYLQILTHPNQDDRDANKDGITNYQAKEIFKGNLLTKDGKQLFRKQIEEFRKQIADSADYYIRKHNQLSFPIDYYKLGYVLPKKDYNILKNYSTMTEEEKKAYFDPIINMLPASYYEERLEADLDSDGFVNGDEAYPEFDSETGKQYIREISDPNNVTSTPNKALETQPVLTPPANPDALSPMPSLPPTPVPEPPALIVPITDTNPITTNTSPENQLKPVSNTDDTDGDGILNRDEKNGEEDDWNVSDRDLAILSGLVYADHLALSNTLGRRDAEKILENKEVFGQKGGLELNYTDEKFFKKWELLEVSEEHSSLALHSTAMAFKHVKPNKNGKYKVVIAYRGTDEGLLELANDGRIALDLDSVNRQAKEQVSILLKRIEEKNIEIGELYLTGHSLGGYEAYHAAVKILEDMPKYRDVLRWATNFNGPGLNISSSSYKTAILNPTKFKSYSSDYSLSYIKSLANAIIVHGLTNNLEHPTESRKVHIEKLRNENVEIGHYYHSMVPLFNDEGLNQGIRSSKDKFEQSDYLLKGTGAKIGKVVSTILNIGSKVADLPRKTIETAVKAIEELKQAVFRLF